MALCRFRNDPGRTATLASGGDGRNLNYCDCRTRFGLAFRQGEVSRIRVAGFTLYFAAGVTANGDRVLLDPALWTEWVDRWSRLPAHRLDHRLHLAGGGYRSGGAGLAVDGPIGPRRH